LRYGEPQAVDAHGAAVPISLELSGSRLTILVDDERAAYPLQIVSLIVDIDDTPYWNSGTWMLI